MPRSRRTERDSFAHAKALARGNARARFIALAVVAAWPFASAACSKGEPHATPATDASAGTVAAITDAGPDGAARSEMVAAAREALDAGRYEGPLVGAMNMVTSVMNEPAWPDADGGAGGVRLGYLRHGAKVPVIAEAIVNEGCSDGWYELVEGGFVCGKGATLDLKNPRVRLAPRPPDMTSPLPYRYGYNLTDGTPLYRRVLSVEDRKKYEPWLAPAPPAPAGSADTAGAADDPAAADDSAAAPVAPIAPIAPSASAAPSASVPWYLRDRDAGRPQVTLGELHGRGVLVRRMVRGFYLALDRDFKAAHAKWWRTTGGLAVPFERIVLQPPLSEYHGIWAPLGELPDGGARPEPAGVIAFATSATHRYTIDPEKKAIGWGAPIPRRTGIELAKATFTSGGSTFQQTTDGSWIRLGEVLLSHASDPPADLAPGEKWIDVDLTRQIVVAFEGTRPVFGTLASTGKRNAYDKDHDYPTPTGTFRIREKHITATMDGDVAGVGPYSIEDVPWVMFFQGSYALHGAFWHDQFGRVMSHGCVNLSPADAKALFAWVEPRLPPGWHGVFATDDKPGTRVIVHEDPPPKGAPH